MLKKVIRTYTMSVTILVNAQKVSSAFYGLMLVRLIQYEYDHGVARSYYLCKTKKETGLQQKY